MVLSFTDRLIILYEERSQSPVPFQQQKVVHNPSLKAHPYAPAQHVSALYSHSGLGNKWHQRHMPGVGKAIAKIMIVGTT